MSNAPRDETHVLREPVGAGSSPTEETPLDGE